MCMFYVLFISIQFRNTCFVGRPVFRTQDGLQYVVATGKSQILSCSLHPKINPKIQSTWWSKSTKYIIADNNKYVIDNHQQSSSLTINNVNHQDNGTYICSAENLKGQAFIEAILLVGGLLTCFNTNIVDRFCLKCFFVLFGCFLFCKIYYSFLKA